jgi:hypothetical protein
MKINLMTVITLCLFFAFFTFCSGPEEKNEQTDSLSTIETPINVNSQAEDNTQEVTVNQDNLLIGKWNYVTTINEMEGVEMKMKVCEKWIMEYRADGTFSETQTLDKDYSKDGKYTKTGNKVKREGLIEFEILELNAKEMIFKAAGVKQVWERIK